MVVPLLRTVPINKRLELQVRSHSECVFALRSLASCYMMLPMCQCSPPPHTHTHTRTVQSEHTTCNPIPFMHSIAHLYSSAAQEQLKARAAPDGWFFNGHTWMSLDGDKQKDHPLLQEVCL